MNPGDGSPTPLSEYLAKHGLTVHAVAKRLRVSPSMLLAEARGVKAPSLATALYYQEMLGIDVRHWRQVPVVALQMEARADPDAQPRKIRNYMRRRYQGDPDFHDRVAAFNKAGQQRKIQLVKEGKAYYTRSANGNPMIKIKPEFKTGRWPNAVQAR